MRPGSPSDRALRRLALGLKLQARHGFAAAYAVATLIFGLVLGALPPAWGARLLPLLAAAEPCFFAPFFAGAFLMLERGAGSFRVLFAAPLTVAAYIAERAILVGLFCAAAGLGLGALAAKGPWSPLGLAAAELAGAALGAPLGMAAAARARSMNGFILSAVPALALLAAPFVLWFVPGRLALAALLPGGGGILLAARALGSAFPPPGLLAGALAAQLAYAALALLGARRSIGRLAQAEGEALS